MILPEDIITLSNLTPEDLTKLIQDEGYLGYRFENATFIGITGEAFVYSIFVPEDYTNDEHYVNVYVVIDDRTRKISADY